MNSILCCYGSTHFYAIDHVLVSATGRSLVQRSPTECVCVFVGVRACHCLINSNNNLYTYNE